MSDPDALAVLAHELRSPLAALEAIERALRDHELDPSEVSTLLALGVVAGRDVERLLSDPELFSVERRRVDVGELLSAVKGAGVELRSEPDLVVSGDPTRLRQALRNLVENGLRHGDHVVVAAAADGRDVVVTVSDDGPGVEAGLDPFARGASGVGSTGLGLYVARGIAEAHGGRLDLVAAPGEGAAFRLVLPRASVASR